MKTLTMPQEIVLGEETRLCFGFSLSLHLSLKLRRNIDKGAHQSLVFHAYRALFFHSDGQFLTLP